MIFKKYLLILTNLKLNCNYFAFKVLVFIDAKIFNNIEYYIFCGNR